MKVLWTIAKVILVLAIAIPVSIMVLATAIGALGALVGLAVLTLRLAVIGLVAWGLFRLAGALFGGRKRPTAAPLAALPPVDPYYEAAKRELDHELGEVR